VWTVPDQEPQLIDEHDRVGWEWTVERGDERRTVQVTFSGTLFNSTRLPSDDLVEGLRTQGRSYLDAHLDREDLPATMFVYASRTLKGNLFEEQGESPQV
jgi:hypothetical protein